MDALTTFPSPASGWILPVEPPLDTAARPSIGADALAIVRQRARLTVLSDLFSRPVRTSRPTPFTVRGKEVVMKLTDRRRYDMFTRLRDFGVNFHLLRERLLPRRHRLDRKSVVSGTSADVDGRRG